MDRAGDLHGSGVIARGIDGGHDVGFYTAWCDRIRSNIIASMNVGRIARQPNNSVF